MDRTCSEFRLVTPLDQLKPDDKGLYTLTFRIGPYAEQKRIAAQRRALQRITESKADAGDGGDERPRSKQETVVRTQPKVGRNDPCPCGSGKKYKKCHGATEATA